MSSECQAGAAPTKSSLLAGGVVRPPPDSQQQQRVKSPAWASCHIQDDVPC